MRFDILRRPAVGGAEARAVGGSIVTSLVVLLQKISKLIVPTAHWKPAPPRAGPRTVNHG